MTLSRLSSIAYTMLLALLAASCMTWDYGPEEDFTSSVGHDARLLILCEGNFQYGNASLSVYTPATHSVENNVFLRANAMKLGDVAQSITLQGDTAWIVVNNSHAIFAIDATTYRELGRIENLPSPRHIHFISPTKAYVTQLWDNRIAIVNPQTFSITGYITIPDMPAATGSTEQMIQLGHDIYVNCWSYQNRILKIDTRTDAIQQSLDIGSQPNSMVMDKYNRLWVITEGDTSAGERPALHCVETSGAMTIDFSYRMYEGDEPRSLTINAAADTIYWINNHIWRMPVEASRLPLRPFVRSNESLFYSLFPMPDASGQLYAADAIDYMQGAEITRFTSTGEVSDRFTVGISPSSYALFIPKILR